VASLIAMRRLPDGDAVCRARNLRRNRCRQHEHAG